MRCACCGGKNLLPDAVRRDGTIDDLKRELALCDLVLLCDECIHAARWVIERRRSLKAQGW